MPSPVKSLGYIKCYSQGSPELLKSLSILSDTTVKRSAVDLEDRKPYWKSEKGQISLGDQQSYYLQIFQRLYLSQKTSWVVVFSCRTFPIIL